MQNIQFYFQQGCWKKLKAHKLSVTVGLSLSFPSLFQYVRFKMKILPVVFTYLGSEFSAVHMLSSYM